MMSVVAYKEWESIVNRLGEGEQIILLRKGGIAEGKEGFRVMHQQFWLYPTQFHEEKNKIKFELPSKLAENDDNNVLIQFFAKVMDVIWVNDLERLSLIDACHGWKRDAVKEKFEYGEKLGLYCIIVRIFALTEPQMLPVLSFYQGCRSWISLETNLDSTLTEVVLDDEKFEQKRLFILNCLQHDK